MPLVCLTKASAMQLPYALPGYAMAGSGRLGSVTAMASISSRTAATLTAQNRSTPSLALSVEQACEALGVSWDTWRAHIEPDVRLVRLGRRKLIQSASCRLGSTGTPNLMPGGLDEAAATNAYSPGSGSVQRS